MFNSTNTDVLLSIKNEQELSVVQDPTHLGGKMRNRILKPSICMPMGQKQVSVGHLKMLIDSVPKDIHGLVRSDILPDDKQNFRSFEKVTDHRVLDALTKNIVDSEATVLYLKISRQMTSAYMEPNLSPLDRISRMWNALYFLRIWRIWLLSQKSCDGLQQLALEKNFISDNAYNCAELNAYNLLHLISKFRDANTPELFLPTLYQSQACEETFREWRSMTTVNWTRINLSLLEVIHLTGRIELRNEIVHFKLADGNVCFPRIQNKSKKIHIYPLPNDEQISRTLKEARDTAMADALRFGMVADIDDIVHCKLRKGYIQQKRKCKPQDEANDEHFDEKDFTFSNLKEYAGKNSELDDRFVQVYDENGSTKTVLKSSLVWTLTETKGVLSKDRLRRVRGESSAPTIKRKNITRKDVETTPYKRIKLGSKRVTDLEVKNHIQVGDWCFFKRYKGGTDNLAVYGAILSFKFTKGNCEKSKQYPSDFAEINTENELENERAVEALATWYKFGDNDILEPFSNNNCFFIDIKNYIATVGAPVISNDKYELQNHHLIKKSISELMKTEKE